jgi:RNase H-like domain found in reverse transcriptase/Integrase zinc binding domain/Integrase core domain
VLLKNANQNYLEALFWNILTQKKPIIIHCDASNEGLSAILFHKVKDIERPVFFASRTLSSAEKKNPILHREALAIVFALEKFYKYVFGHHCTVYTDHKPLIGILNFKKGEPPVIVNRLQRYMFRLSIFDFKLEYRKGKENGNADCLSRLPLSDVQMTPEDKEEEKRFEINNLQKGSKMDFNLKLLAQETEKDLFLSQLGQFVQEGWQISQIPIHYKSYFLKNESLSIESGVVCYNGRAIIPKRLQPDVLRVLHSNHAGIVNMKRIARQYVYWAHIDDDIQKFVENCESCQVVNIDKQGKAFGVWPEPKKPFERVHLDFFHFRGKTFLIFIDAFSRWLEIRIIRNNNAESLIKILKSIFRIFGGCLRLVTDNGPRF